MTIEHMDYSQLSEAAMAAADNAPCLDDYQALLARAVRYACLASMERRRSPDCNLVPIRPLAAAQF